MMRRLCLRARTGTRCGEPAIRARATARPPARTFAAGEDCRGHSRASASLRHSDALKGATEVRPLIRTVQTQESVDALVAKLLVQIRTVDEFAYSQQVSV